MGIEAIIFDFAGVMVAFPLENSIRLLEGRLGLRPESLAPLLWDSPDWNLAQLGIITDVEYWRWVGDRLGLTTPTEIENFRRVLFRDARTDERMVDLVHGLRGRYRTALLSNATDILPRLMRERYQLDGLFDVELISAFVGLAKPDPGIYRLALERLDASPKATVFVDDSAANVAAAAALGIHAIHFDRFDSLFLALQELGVTLDRAQ